MVDFRKVLNGLISRESEEDRKLRLQFQALQEENTLVAGTCRQCTHVYTGQWELPQQLINEAEAFADVSFNQSIKLFDARWKWVHKYGNTRDSMQGAKIIESYYAYGLNKITADAYLQVKNTILDSWLDKDPEEEIPWKLYYPIYRDGSSFDKGEHLLLSFGHPREYHFDKSFIDWNNKNESKILYIDAGLNIYIPSEDMSAIFKQCLAVMEDRGITI